MRMPDNRVLKVVFDQTQRHRDSQFLVRQNLISQLTARFGRCVGLAMVFAAVELFEAAHERRCGVLLGGALALSLTLLAAVQACAGVRHPPALPGRLPSDFWAELCDPRTEERRFLTWLIADTRGIIELEWAAHARLDRAARRSRQFAAAASVVALLTLVASSAGV